MEAFVCFFKTHCDFFVLTRRTKRILDNFCAHVGKENKLLSSGFAKKVVKQISAKNNGQIKKVMI